jgi:ABC-type phosphate/phosphonate transport system substrate-binding protein
MENISVLLTTVSTPQTNISFSPDIPLELSTRLINYFITTSKEVNALAKICQITDSDQQVTRLIEIIDSYYNQFRDLFERAGKNPADYQYTGL